jgi:cysteine synthase A
MGADQLAARTGARNILTFFPDRGDLYGDQFLGASEEVELARVAG